MSKVWNTIEVEILEEDMKTLSDMCFDGDLESCKTEIGDYREEEYNKMVMTWFKEFYSR